VRGLGDRVLTYLTYTVADLEGGRAGSSSPLSDGLTPSLTVLLTTVLYYNDTIAILSLQARKTWYYSEYSKWLPPVALWQP